MEINNTLLLFRHRAVPERPFNRNPTTNPTGVAEAYINIFRGYDVRHWAEFGSEAAKILSTNLQDLSTSTMNEILGTWSSVQGMQPASIESQLYSALYSGVLVPTNKLCDFFHEHLPASLGRWDLEAPLPGNRKCDFLLQGSVSQTLVVGEVKKPVDYDLRNPHNASWLKERLGQSKNALLDDRSVMAYLQLFSYILDSAKGMGILCSYKHFRFFRLNLVDKRIYMSSAVALTQKLSANRQEPHVIQAFLYISSLERNDSEFTQSMAFQLCVDAGLTCYAKYLPKSKNKTETKTPAARKDSSRHPSRQTVSTRSGVTTVLKNSDYIGELGHGIIGTEEYEYNGLRIAVKIGQPFKAAPERDVDPSELINNEIAIYEHLRHLQGTVIPRVVAGGPDKWFTGGGMILITEKVGNKLRKRSDGFYMDKERLSAKEADEVERCALQGLELINASYIMHSDIALKNLRVERVDGKMHVWWLDFGMSRNMLYYDSKREELGEDELERRRSELSKIERDRCIRPYE